LSFLLVKLALGILLQQDVEEIKGVFPQKEFEKSPLAQAIPCHKKSTHLWVPRAKPWHGDAIELLIIVRCLLLFVG
jgi:hypothetical protein